MNENYFMKSRYRFFPVLIILLLALSIGFAYSESNPEDITVWTHHSWYSIPARRLSDVEIRIKNTVKERIEGIFISISQPEGMEVRLRDPRIDVMYPQASRTLVAEIRPNWNFFNKRETLTLIFHSGERTATRTIIVTTSPVPWFWPVIGGTFGLIVAGIFIVIFHRFSREE